MAPKYHSSSIAGVQTSHANEYVTSPAALSVTLPPARSGLFLEPGQHPPTRPSPVPIYSEHDLEVVSQDSMKPPPSYTESSMRVVVGDSKAFPHAIDPPSPPLRTGPIPNPGEHGNSPYVEAPEGPSSLQLCDRDSAGHGTPRPAPVPISTYCATICTAASKHLNYHVDPDNHVSRWQTTDGPIPIGINLSSFESREQRSLVKICLEIVLRSLNNSNIGPKFHFVRDPCRSAFSVTFGGDHPHCYASSFFPGSHPKDWYIYIFKLGLTLSEEQEQLLIHNRGGEVESARLQALGDNLIKILAHEMLHVVGVRHCHVDLDEKEPYVRFPLELSDNDNWDPLMQPRLDPKDFSRLDWRSQTLEEIRQIYAMNEGDSVGCHRIQDVSWRDGRKVRKRMARINAQCCTSKRRNED